jgi:sugar lactone lactonase YvrE
MMQFDQILEGFTFLEAPRVDDAGNLYFSEVMEGGVCRLSPDGKLDRFITDRKSIGGLVFTDDGGFICSGAVGLEYYNPANGERRMLDLSFNGEPLRGLNDIQPDDLGSIYAGATDFASIQAGRKPKPGKLYRIDPPGRVVALWDGIAVSNGIGFSTDRTQMYFAETLEGVCVFDFASDRTISNRRLLAPMRGVDGLAVDAEGGIWVAGYNSGDVTRYLPDGKIDRRIDFSQRFTGCAVTSLTFGGPDLRDLTVVTGGDYRKPAGKHGRVYRGRSDVPGQRTPTVRF